MVSKAELYFNPAYQTLTVHDAAVVRDAGKLRPYLRLANLSNTGYQEINGVAMPGRSGNHLISVETGEI